MNIEGFERVFLSLIASPPGRRTGESCAFAPATLCITISRGGFGTRPRCIQGNKSASVHNRTTRARNSAGRRAVALRVSTTTGASSTICW